MSFSIHQIDACRNLLEMQEILPAHREGLKNSLHKVDRIVQYYQNIGSLPRLECPPEERSFSRRVSHETVQDMGEASLPGTAGTVFLISQIGQKSISSLANILSAIPAVGSQSPLVTQLAYPAGGIWSCLALWEVKGGVSDWRRAELIEDGEGKKRAIGRIISGSAVATGAVSFIASKITTGLGLIVATAALGLVCSLFFGLGCVAASSISSVGYLRCHRFHGRIDQYLENESIPEERRLGGALHFLQNLLFITSEERATVIQKVLQENPQMNLEEREDLIQKKLIHLSEVKIKYLKRRTSNKSLQLIHNRAAPILEKLESNHPLLKAQGIEEARELIRIVQAENTKKKILYAISFIAAVIGLIAIIVGTFFTLGALPFILSTIAGVIYALLTIQNLGFQWTKKNLELTTPS